MPQLASKPDMTPKRPQYRGKGSQNSLPTSATKEAAQRIPTPGLGVNELLERPVAVLDRDLVLLDHEVAGHVAAGDFPAVGAVAQVASALGEELGVGDCYRDAAA